MLKKLLSLSLILCVVLSLFVLPFGAAAAGEEGNDKAKIDTTNIADGYVRAKFTGSGNSKIKFMLTDPKGIKYTYDLNASGNYETFPLSGGDGEYSAGVFQNTSGTKYAQSFATKFSAKLKDQNGPFLVANQYVNYTKDSKVVAQAATLTKGIAKDLDKVSKIYSFVIDGFTYDKKLAETVQTGYLPDVDKVLAAKKGICFDYAAVMTSMLRSQKIPTKLVVGYAGTAYHAWISVYTKETGWIDNIIEFDGKNWKLMDPTFASSGKKSPEVMKYIGDGKNYQAKFYY